MKIIRFDAFPDSHAAYVPDGFFTDNAVLMADSCWRPHRRPLFVPTEGFWLCGIRVAVRISRLGKAIAPKFANRYYDGFCLVNYLVREADAEQFSTPDCMIDDSLIHGEWLPMPEDNSTEFSFSIQGLSETSANSALKSFTIPVDYLDRALSILSHEATFKNGDVIILPQSLARYVPHPDMHITADVDGKTVLDFKIK